MSIKLRLMTMRLILLVLTVSHCYSCASPPLLSYEELTKWGGGDKCDTYPQCYHYGDWAWAQDDYEKICVPECKEHQESISCEKACISKLGYSLAEQIEGGYYSDGSYYMGSHFYRFANVHPTRDKYKKTKWQKDRDECMQLTFENVKLSYWEETIHFKRYVKRGKDYFKSCLKERGYLI